jgi:hypothetical protein
MFMLTTGSRKIATELRASAAIASGRPNSIDRAENGDARRKSKSPRLYRARVALVRL